MWAVHNSPPKRVGEAVSMCVWLHCTEHTTWHTHLGQGINGSVNAHQSVASMCPSQDLMEVGLYFCDLLPPNHKPRLIRKTSYKFQKRDILQCTWLIFLKVVKVTKNKESVRNCHNQEKTTEIWTNYGFQLIMCYQYWFFHVTHIPCSCVNNRGNWVHGNSLPSPFFL